MTLSEMQEPFTLEPNAALFSDIAQLRALVEQARQYAQAPISGFTVGALAVGASGRLYLGTNLEFLNQPLSHTIHAEQFAVSLARQSGESGLQHVVVSALPCGHCRQFLAELGHPDLPITVLTEASQDDTTLSALFPQPFTLASPERCLMPATSAPLTLVETSDDVLALHALDAASLAYVPYTGAYSGVAILTESGDLFRGSAIESAAFNPTLPALQAAFIQMASQHVGYHEISEVLFVESADSRASASVSAWNLIKSLSPLAQLSFLTATPSPP